MNTDSCASPIYKQDDEPARVHILLKGLVKLEGESYLAECTVYDFHCQGELFGDIVGHGYYTETAKPVVASVVKSVEREDIIKFDLRECLDEAIRNLDMRCRSARNDVSPSLNTAFRTANALLRLGRRLRVRRCNPRGSSWVELPIARQELANHVSTTRETVQRALADLKNAGVVEDGHKRITSIVYDVDALERYVEDLAQSRL